MSWDTLPDKLRSLGNELSLLAAEEPQKAASPQGPKGDPGRDGVDGKDGLRGPSGFDHADAEVLTAAWADLRATILTPRKRKVIRDARGNITGLTDA